MAEGEEAPEERDVVVVGLVCDPGLPAEMAERLANRLPGELSLAFDGAVEWRVDTRLAPLPLDEHGDIPLASTARRFRRREGWDLLVALTDLPRRVGTRPLLASIDTGARAGLVSVPAAGWPFSFRRVRETIVHLVARLSGGSGGGRAVRPRRRLRPVPPPSSARRFSSPDPESMDESLELVGTRGKLRLLTGMVRANRPWRLLPSLSSAIAAAVATSSFGVFYNSIWQMADTLHPARLALVNAFAVVAMAAWLIAYNGLWERPDGARLRRAVVLYNASTVCTVGLGVLCMYVLLFTVTLAEALVVIDSSFMESVVGHPAGLKEYVLIAWMASSMGTVAGALGSTFESESAVRAAAYSERERERRERFEEERGEHEEAEQAEPGGQGS
ncbi:hypothetical protein O4J56_30425 [Nocardiopsis sp. RSe5-2]|uniref:DUF2267 domain-containing protein n=1 Tax=Nocardiopsis endophytica TaxID=3018445 RepID=A0ABT4UF61_9ACTN|nr:hypothetical protein [Nocardiopsis endophytica]MDA2815000.1 hypothetical protein [Nocardiopsis endophytica]